MDKVALDFCKLSPYLREEYGILKRGLKIKELNKYSLINVVKDFIEYEEIGMSKLDLIVLRLLYSVSEYIYSALILDTENWLNKLDKSLVEIVCIV